MLKNKILLAAATLLLPILRLSLHPFGYEFKWLWLNIASDFIIPLSIIALLTTCFVKHSSWLLKALITFIILLLSLIFVVFYLFNEPAGSTEHHFKSHSKKNTVIVKERSILLLGEVYFYKPKLFFFKKHIKKRTTDDGYAPFKEGDFSVKWNTDETKCKINWDGGFSNNPLDSITITFE